MTRAARRGTRALMAVVVLLMIFGIAAGIARALYPQTLGERAELVRANVWQALDLRGPVPAQRAEEVKALEARYVDDPSWIFVHASVGSVFLFAAAFQFSPRLRTKYVHIHRWIGRALVVMGVILAVTGMYFGVLIPAAGVRETIVISLAGVLFVLSLISGALAARRKDIPKHREWMIRAFAVALGIATVRVVALVADATLTPRGWALQDVFVLSLALGWGITSTCAELWIRFDRGTSRPEPAVVAQASMGSS